MRRFWTTALALIVALSLMPVTAFGIDAGTQIQGVTAQSTEYRTVELSWDAAEPADQAGSAEPAADVYPDPATDPESDPELDPEISADQDPAAEPAEVIYSVYRATSKSGAYKVIAETTDNFYMDVKLTAGKKYFYKVSAQAGDITYSKSKAVSVTVLKQKAAAMSLIMEGDEAFNYREKSGEKLYKYDTLQGACANDGYGYFSLYNRNVEKCKIVKVDLATLDIVKVSEPLKVYHANNMAFNTSKNLIAATCCKVKKNRVVFVDPETLSVVSHKDVKLTSKVKGLPSKIRKRNQGFTAIAYNQDNDCYVGRLRDGDNAIIFDGELNPVKYVKLSGKKRFLLAQGMESAGDYIYDIRSFKGKHKYSMVTIHTMSGKLVGQLRFPYAGPAGHELQCIFHDGEQFYAGFYLTTSQYHDTKAHHVIRWNEIYTLDKSGLGL